MHSEREASWIIFLIARYRLGITLRIQTESYPDWYWLWYWCEPWVPDWIVSCKTDTWEYRLSRIRIDIDYGIRVNLEFLIELHLVRQIPENTDWVVSGFVLTMVLVINLDWYVLKSVYRSRAFTSIRPIWNAKYKSHTDPLFSSMNFLPFPGLVEQEKMKFMHSSVLYVSPLASDPIRVQPCVCCLFWTNRNSMAVTSIFLSISLSN